MKLNSIGIWGSGSPKPIVRDVKNIVMPDSRVGPPVVIKKVFTKNTGNLRTMILEMPDRQFLWRFIVTGEKLLNKIFIIMTGLLIVFTNTTFGASCPTNYAIAKHNIHLDFNVSTALPELIEQTQKTAANDMFILSAIDGTCPSGYTPYSLNKNSARLMIETPTLCPDGQHLNANGTCVNYTACSGNYLKYNISDTTVTQQNENNECNSGYTQYADLSRCDASSDYQCVDLPTIININWYSMDEIVATNTCRYGQPITLPTPPTRPGYTFAGWRLIRNQNSTE